MPNLRCLYLNNNKVVQNYSNYRKTVIAKMPKLTYLDDRPVFEEDRRRAEAFMRGGLEEEREEMKRIRKEKDDRHWANHEAFLLMMKEAKEKHQAKEQEKQDKKDTMKEMMAKAKAKKNQKDQEQQKEDQEETKDFLAQVKEKAEQRYHEKQNNIEHSEKYDPAFKTDVQIQDELDNREAAKIYDQLVIEESKKPDNPEDDKNPIKEEETDEPEPKIVEL